jgi:hypothetical protein
MFNFFVLDVLGTFFVLKLNSVAGCVLNCKELQASARNRKDLKKPQKPEKLSITQTDKLSTV